MQLVRKLFLRRIFRSATVTMRTIGATIARTFALLLFNYRTNYYAYDYQSANDNEYNLTYSHTYLLNADEDFLFFNTITATTAAITAAQINAVHHHEPIV